MAGATPFSEGALVTPLPGPKSREDTPLHPDLDGPDYHAYQGGFAEDTADDDTAPGSVSHG